MAKSLHQIMLEEGYEFKEVRDSRDATLEFNCITIPKKVGENIIETLGVILPKTVALMNDKEQVNYGSRYYVYWKKR